jgi:hypothetical protein
VAVAGVAFGVVSAVRASEVTGLTTFTAGTPAKAGEVNSNFAVVKSAVDNNYSRIVALESGISARSRVPVHIKLNATCDSVNGTCSASYVVPAGKRLVLQALAASEGGCAISGSFVGVDPTNASDEFFWPHLPQPPFREPLNNWIVPAGGHVRAECIGWSSNSIPCTCTQEFLGYFETE